MYADFWELPQLVLLRMFYVLGVSIALFSRRHFLSLHLHWCSFSTKDLLFSSTFVLQLSCLPWKHHWEVLFVKLFPVSHAWPQNKWSICEHSSLLHISRSIYSHCCPDLILHISLPKHPHVEALQSTAALPYSVIPWVHAYLCHKQTLRVTGQT